MKCHELLYHTKAKKQIKFQYFQSLVFSLTFCSLFLICIHNLGNSADFSSKPYFHDKFSKPFKTTGCGTTKAAAVLQALANYRCLFLLKAEYRPCRQFPINDFFERCCTFKLGILRHVHQFICQPFPDQVGKRFAKQVALPEFCGSCSNPVHEIPKHLFRLLFGADNRRYLRLYIHANQMQTRRPCA